MVFGSTQIELNWYTYGRSHFTSKGYEDHAKLYTDTTFHDNVDLKDKTYMITGANSGLGKGITRYLAQKGAHIYMVCRSEERALAVRDEVIAETSNSNVKVLVCDVGIESDVRQMWNAFISDKSDQKLHGLLCNAGALLKEYTANSDNLETTFACHLAMGTYLLGSLAMPLLESTEDSRLVIMSSGGMYTRKVPSWEVLTYTCDESTEKYDGLKAYGYNKRAQVVLAEQWSKLYTNTKIVSVHPGWCETEGVSGAFTNEEVSYLKPLRDNWQGIEGACWLLAAPSSSLQTGEFYLDRAVAPKYISGLFWTEGGQTKNTESEIRFLMANLDRITNTTRQSPLVKEVFLKNINDKTLIDQKLMARKNFPVKPFEQELDTAKFSIGWKVLAAVPLTFLGEHRYMNPIENYKYDSTKNRVEVDYRFHTIGDALTVKKSSAKQLGYFHNALKTHWRLQPQILYMYWPINANYLILHIAEDYSWCLTGVPSGDYVWLLTRDTPSRKDSFPLPEGAAITSSNEKDGATVEGVETETEGRLTVEQEANILKEGITMAIRLGYNVEKLYITSWTE